MGLILSKNLGQGQVKYGHQMKMLHDDVRRMFYESFGTQNSLMTFIFKFDLRKGQFHVKLGQIR